MNAYHILSGRLWLFDRRVTYDGNMSTYIFTKDHKKITLTPLKYAHPTKPKENREVDALVATL